MTQKERWRATDGGGIGGGTVTTAGNLVFQVIPDGRLVAYSADKGEKLLDIQTGLRGGMGPPITYQLDGKQYVALAGGIGEVVPRYQDAPGGPPPPAAGAAAPNAPPDLANGPAASAPINPKMLTYAIDAK